MIATALAEMFEPRYSRRYIGRHRAGRPRYVGTAVVAGPAVATSTRDQPAPSDAGPDAEEPGEGETEPALATGPAGPVAEPVERDPPARPPD